MPDEGVPSYATGRHTFMILHDYDQKVANDPKMSKAAGKVKNALMPGKAHSTFAWTAAYLMAKEPIDLDAFNIVEIRINDHFSDVTQGGRRDFLCCAS